ncbi:MAG TPA: adenylate/guanylate cyclase domain-containing protein [Candidatus Bathyarchaeia archaeon]|nr:adenylate/guanylate cyclase domain-containing protein [Candidatus Bathyarchaeia archaeon]
MSGYLANLSVRGKIVLLISLVVSLLLTAVLTTVWMQGRAQVKSVVENDFKERENAFLSIEQYRIRDRAHVAYLIGAKSAQLLKPSEKAQRCQFLQHILDVQGTDPNDSAHIDYAAFQDVEGRVLAIAFRGQPLCDPQLERWPLPNVQEALEKLPLLTSWHDPSGHIYSIYAARVTEGTSTKPIGTMAIGYLLDDVSANLVRKRAAVDVVFWREEDTQAGLQPVVIAASNPSFGPALIGKLADARNGIRFQVGGERLMLQELAIQAPGVQVRNPEHVHLGVVQSITKQVVPFITLQTYLAVLAAASLLLGVVLGLIFSNPIVKPLVGLANVAREVEKGKYDGIQQLRVDHRRQFQSKDEIGTLCRAFEEMLVGLGQRQTMSKFMSHSAYSSLETCGTCHTERKWMCVLFSDIRNFSGFSDGRDPESVVQRLNQVLGIQANIVAKHGGDIDKFIGDAMVAWFTGDDRCQRAANAAREMLAELASRVGACDGGQVGVGIHVGEVIVGALGSQDRLDYTAIGSTVNLSERLCAAAQRGQVLVSQAVVTELGSSVPALPLPPIHVKGFAEEIAVYEIYSEAESASAAAACENLPNAKVN